MPGVTMHLIAGTAYGRTAPTPTFSPMFYLAVEMEAGSSFELPNEHEERGVYVVCGDAELAGSPLPEHHFAVVPTGESVRVRARSVARVMMCGGSPLGDRYIWWNFVASSRELIDEAAQRWKSGGFPAVPGESEFIPLPDERMPGTTFVP